MNADAIIENICRLSIDFYGGSKSMVDLVYESGITDHPSRHHLLVGFNPNGESLRFGDSAVACAELMAREVAAIMKIRRRRA